MSELSSLYARVHLSATALRAFEESRPANPGDYGDWRPWLDQATYYGTISDADIAAPFPGREATVRAYIDDLCAPAFNGPAMARYAPDTQTWTLAVAQCSENYSDFMDVLSVIRAIAAYKDLPGDDFVLIYPYLWGGAPEAHLTIAAGASRFVMPAPGAAVAEADVVIKRMCDEFVAGMDLGSL